MVVLYLNLCREWFCKILEETKTIEYRDKTAYWKKRLIGKRYTHIRFRNGYQAVAPEMIVELKKIRETPSQYELCLGKIVSKKNIRLLK